MDPAQRRAEAEGPGAGFFRSPGKAAMGGAGALCLPGLYLPGPGAAPALPGPPQGGNHFNNNQGQGGNPYGPPQGNHFDNNMVI